MCCRLRRQCILTWHVISLVCAMLTVALVGAVVDQIDNSSRRLAIILGCTVAAIAVLIFCVMNCMSLLKLRPYDQKRAGFMFYNLRLYVDLILVCALWTCVFLFMDMAPLLTYLCTGWVALLVSLALVGINKRSDDGKMGCCGTAPSASFAPPMTRTTQRDARVATTAEIQRLATEDDVMSGNDSDVDVGIEVATPEQPSVAMSNLPNPTATGDEKAAIQN